MHGVKKYIFACVHNAGRSQMAAAWFGLLADPALAVGLSAGTAPAQCVHPEVVTVMREVGIELAHVTPRHLTNELAADATLLVTMGCGETCPFVPGLRILDWALADPKGQSLEAVRSLRDDIHERVRRLVVDEGVARPAAG